MADMSRGLLADAARLRSRIAADWCPVVRRTGQHNYMDAQHWFRRYRVCATCGYVIQVPR